MLAASARRRFADVRRYDEVDSTNRTAAALGSGQEVVVVADHQTDGRGRRGRRWDAPPGSSLLVSVVLRLPASTPPQLATVAMGLAARDACRAVGARLKWPNDLVVDDRKLGGVLGEVLDGHERAVVVGLGLNVDWGSVEMPPGATSLARLTGRPVDRERLLGAVLGHLERRVAQPPERLIEDFRACSATLGRRVRVELATGSFEGEAVDITNAGHLVVARADGSRHVVAAGEVVHLRAAPPAP